jgi:hypothetical protein
MSSLRKQGFEGNYRRLPFLIGAALSPPHCKRSLELPGVITMLSTNHNQTLIAPIRVTANHNQTVVRTPFGTQLQHNQTLVRPSR